MTFTVTHGQSGGGVSPTPTYGTWQGMKKRCNNPNASYYEEYGGRGITYDPRWESFENFFEDMGERPEGCTLDRINGDGDYTKDNCRWATTAVQNGNKSNARWITFNGETHTIAEWSRKLGGSQSTIRNRLNVWGWSVEEALTRPITKSRVPYHKEVTNV